MNSERHAANWGPQKTNQSRPTRGRRRAIAPLNSVNLILSDVSWLMFCFYSIACFRFFKTNARNLMIYNYKLACNAGSFSNSSAL